MKDFWKYFRKNISKLIVILALALVSFLPAFADEEVVKEDPPSLYFYAVNAGYKNDESSQNYDFFELRKSSEDDLSLGDYEIIYTNSSNNEAGRISFDVSEKMVAESVVFGFAKSPAYQAEDGKYLYAFSSAGLASTSGKLSLFQSDELIDEICWGKLSCEKSLPSFSTSEENNNSAVLSDEGFVFEKYYPAINSTAINEAAEKSSCEALELSEIYSYYETSSSEQFIEIKNNSSETIALSGCSVRYKNKSYALDGEILPNAYYIYQNEALVLTKNPTTSNLLEIIDANDKTIDYVEYPHGQKQGLSYVKIDEEWRLTHNRTPGAANIYQEFQTCQDGKEINPETGNCVNVEEETETTCPEGKYLNPETGRCKNIETTTVKTCEEGYYLNPETNRCKKLESESTLTECADGYERNPETNRCRKIQTTDASEYAPATRASTDSYSAPKRFIAYGVVILAIGAGLIYVIIQYREELIKITKKLLNKFRRSKKLKSEIVYN